MISRRTFLTGSLKLMAAASGLSGISRWLGGSRACAFPPDPYWEHCAVLRMVFHENPLGPSPAVFDALERLLSRPTGIGGMSMFPDRREIAPLEELILRYNNLQGSINTDSVILGAGSTELLVMAADLLVDASHPMITEWPTYNIIIGRAIQNGGEVFKIPLREDGFGRPTGPDYEAVLSCLGENPAVRLVHFNVTNNPTGCIVTDPDFSEFALEVRQSHPETVILADSSDPEFADPEERERFPDFGSLILQDYSILWVQTFSHIFGMTGLRLGYGIAPSDLAERLVTRKIRDGVGNAALAAGIASLVDPDGQVERSYLNNALGRDFLASELRTMGYPSLPSQGAYLLFDTGCSGLVYFLLLILQGVWVRPGLEWDLRSWLRVNPGKHPGENEQFLDALGWISGLEESRLDLDTFLTTQIGKEALDSLSRVGMKPDDFLGAVRG